MKVERAGSGATPNRPHAPTIVPSSRLGNGDISGIPTAEITPRVREVITGLRREIKRLREELQKVRLRLDEAGHAADQDQLLPILNRRAFVRELTRHLSLAARYGTPACLLYVDLDGFKQINDTHGHAGGDAVLAHFAQILCRAVRETDVVGRLGGDEFGVILAHASQVQADKKADELLAALGHTPAFWNGKTLHLAFASGSCEFVAGETAEGMIARADAAMYQRKHLTR